MRFPRNNPWCPDRLGRIVTPLWHRGETRVWHLCDRLRRDYPCKDCGWKGTWRGGPQKDCMSHCQPCVGTGIEWGDIPLRLRGECNRREYLTQ